MCEVKIGTAISINYCRLIKQAEMAVFPLWVPVTFRLVHAKNVSQLQQQYLRSNKWKLFMSLLFCSNVKHCRNCKGTVSRDFRSLFCTKTQPGPHMNRLKRFCELFRYANIFDYKDRNSQVHVAYNFSLREPSIFIFLKQLNWLNKPTPNTFFDWLSGQSKASKIFHRCPRSHSQR